MSIVKFSEVAHRAYTREDRFNTEKIYYVGGEHIDSCELYVTKKGVIKGSTIGPMFYCGFTAGQILFVTRNPHLKKCSIADFDGICSEKTFVIETKDESILTQEYLAIIMQSDDFWNYCEENKSGGVNYFLNWSTLADYEFELPPIKQQLEIAQKVMSAYRLKQSYKKLLDATREMVKSQFIEMFGTVENNTHNFPIMTIGEFANCFAGATPSTSHPEYWENGRIRWMSSGEVHKGHVEDTDSRITELGYKSASTRMVPIHSIVIAIAGQGKTRGTVAITEVDLCTNQSLCAIVPDERVNYSYLYHNLQGRYLELRGLSGDVNGRGGLNLKIIQKIPVILPPIEKQQQFASIAQQADKSKSVIQKALVYLNDIQSDELGKIA